MSSHLLLSTSWTLKNSSVVPGIIDLPAAEAVGKNFCLAHCPAGRGRFAGTLLDRPRENFFQMRNFSSPTSGGVCGLSSQGFRARTKTA